MTGVDNLGPWNAILDDGEWISWDFINENIEDHKRRELFPQANVQLVRIFEDLVTVAADYHGMTGRLIDRKALGKRSGKHAKVNWHAHEDSVNPA